MKTGNEAKDQRACLWSDKSEETNHENRNAYTHK